MNDTTAQKFGITNLKTVVAVGLEAANVGDEIGRLGSGAGIARWFKLTSLFDELMALQGVKWSQLDDEIKDIDDAEAAELHQFVKDKFDIADDKLEAAIETAVGLVKKQYDVVSEAIQLARDLKAQPSA